MKEKASTPTTKTGPSIYYETQEGSQSDFLAEKVFLRCLLSNLVEMLLKNISLLLLVAFCLTVKYYTLQVQTKNYDKTTHYLLNTCVALFSVSTVFQTLFSVLLMCKIRPSMLIIIAFVSLNALGHTFLVTVLTWIKGIGPAIGLFVLYIPEWFFNHGRKGEDDGYVCFWTFAFSGLLLLYKCQEDESGGVEQYKLKNGFAGVTRKRIGKLKAPENAILWAQMRWIEWPAVVNICCIVAEVALMCAVFILPTLPSQTV